MKINEIEIAKLKLLLLLLTVAFCRFQGTSIAISHVFRVAIAVYFLVEHMAAKTGVWLVTLSSVYGFSSEAVFTGSTGVGREEVIENTFL